LTIAGAGETIDIAGLECAASTHHPKAGREFDMTISTQLASRLGGATGRDFQAAQNQLIFESRCDAEALTGFVLSP
jgi:hypothetical protein